MIVVVLGSGIIGFIVLFFIGKAIGRATGGDVVLPPGGLPGARDCNEAKKELEKQQARVDALKARRDDLHIKARNAAIALATTFAASVAAGVAAAAAGWIMPWLYGVLAAALAAFATASGVVAEIDSLLTKNRILLEEAERQLKAHENAVKKFCP